jgi:hypothetical protein
MHTYLKSKDGDDDYAVGQWLVNREGYHQFFTLFSVPTLKQAFTAVNALNGGTRISPDALHLIEGGTS